MSKAKKNDNRVGQVMACSPGLITVLIDSLEIFEKHKLALQIGRYLKIQQGNNDFTIASIRNIRGVTTGSQEHEYSWQFQIDCQAVGTLNDEKKFERSSILLPVPTEPAFVADEDTLDKIFSEDNNYQFSLGCLSLNQAIPFRVDGDCFFSKHIAVVGSTGSGKSCTVARILHDVVGIDGRENCNLGKQNNSHIVIFDIHDEYTSAFQLAEEQSFNLNRLDVDTLNLPYWLMNSEELESIFIESNEQNSHNQVSQFKQAVILNKEKHNPEIKEVTYDMPVYFSIEEVFRYIENMNREVIGRLPNENKPKLADGTLVSDRKDYYFDAVHNFAAQSQKQESKASVGSFNGEFNRFISRLETKLSDKRLRFLLQSEKTDGELCKTCDFEDITKQFLGYLDKSNVTIVDLSGIPFEVLSITVSLVSRLIFDFCFHYSKLCHDSGGLNDIPVMIVCEEAHNYIPQREDAAYRSSRKSLERVAKEGRKYGLSLMVVSQRPSEVSETIFAQCNNFISLRLTNSADQNYVKRLFPDNSNGITDVLPNLAPGECIVVGDAVLLPAVIQMPLPDPEPNSRSICVHQEWEKPWRDITFSDVISRWRKENSDTSLSDTTE